MSFLFGNRSSKTFKPKKNIPEGSKQHELMQHAAATLGSGFEDCFQVLLDFPGHTYRTTMATLYIQGCIFDVNVYCAGNLRLAVMLPEGEDINE